MDAATKDDPEVDLTWLLRCPNCFVPVQKYRDHCDRAPSDLYDWLAARIGCHPMGTGFILQIVTEAQRVWPA